MRKIFYLLLCVCTTSYAQDNNDSLAIRAMQNIVLDKSQCYQDLRVLCKTIGHRLSGSPAAAKAVEWGQAALKSAGANKVYLQPVMVPHWIRGNAQCTLSLGNGKKQNLAIMSLGNSVGSGAKGINAEIIEVKDKEHLELLGEAQVKGKIVFFNHVWDQHKCNPFHEYGNSVFYRWAGPSLAAKYGAVAMITRSAGSAYDNYIHTGSMRYDSAYPKIPAVSIGYSDAVALSALLEQDEVASVSLINNCHFEPDVLSYNVIGELTGTTFPNEIITVGGHLDSWDVGEGAHDDGAGVVQSIEVIRAMVQAGLRPRRTIRCVLFMNEENGLRGGTEYARLAALNNETHVCAIETDAGGFSPRGFEMECSAAQRQKVKTWLPLFLPLGVYNLDDEGAGADIGPLHRTLKTPVMELLPDPQRYFDLHHTHNDVFEQVHRRELSMGALAMSAMAWLLSEHGL